MPWRRLLAMVLSCSTLAIAGCKDAPAPQPLKPVVVDLAAVRCPNVGAADRVEAIRRTQRPAAPVVKSAAREWIDTLEVSEARKNAALDRAHAALDACRGQR